MPCCCTDLDEAVSVPMMPLKYFDTYDCPTAATYTPVVSSSSSNILDTEKAGTSRGTASGTVDALAQQGTPLLASYPQASDFARLPDTLRLPQDLHSALLGRYDSSTVTGVEAVQLQV
jgi:hypothetical protein